MRQLAMVMGRPKGRVNKLTASAIDIAERMGIHPLEHLLKVMHDPNKSDELRADCAKASLPYVLPRLAALDVRALIEQAPRTPQEIEHDLNSFLETIAHQRITTGTLVVEHPSTEQRDLIGSLDHPPDGMSDSESAFAGVER